MCSCFYFLLKEKKEKAAEVKGNKKKLAETAKPLTISREKKRNAHDRITYGNTSSTKNVPTQTKNSTHQSIGTIPVPQEK